MASPRVSRPPDSRSRDAACLASRAVLRSGPITTMVTSRARVVTAAAADRAANGSTLRYTIRSSTPRLANGPWSARRAHSRIPVPSAPGVVVGSPTPTSIARSSPPLDQFWCAEREPSYGEVCLPRTWGGSDQTVPPTLPSIAEESRANGHDQGSPDPQTFRPPSRGGGRRPAVRPGWPDPWLRSLGDRPAAGLRDRDQLPRPVGPDTGRRHPRGGLRGGRPPAPGRGVRRR